MTGPTSAPASTGSGRASSALAALVVASARHTGSSIATAESLTGGLVAAAVTSVPGASDCFRGGVIAYASAVKQSVLGVPGALLAQRGAVDPDVASAMADGARRVLDADWAVATTGVAGPAASDGKPVGTVFVAVAGPSGMTVRELALTGTRGAIRDATVAAALELLAAGLAGEIRVDPRSAPR